jgi:hypothetical protein
MVSVVFCMHGSCNKYTQNFGIKPHSGPVVGSSSNRSEYHGSSWGGKTRPARKADNLTAIGMILDASQTYRPLRPDTRTTFLSSAGLDQGWPTQMILRATLEMRHNSAGHI